MGSGTQGKAPHESRSPFCHMRSRASQAGGGGTDAAPSWNARPRSRSPALTPPGQPCPFVFTPGQRVTAASCPSLLRTAVPSFGRASRRPPSPPFPPPTHFLWRVPCAFVRTHTELCMFLTLYSQYCAIDLFPTFPPRLTYTHPCGCVCTPNTASPGRPLLPSADLAWGLRSRDRRGTVLNKAGKVPPFMGLCFCKQRQKCAQIMVSDGGRCW